MTDIAEKTPAIIPKTPAKAPSRLPSVVLPAVAFFMVTLDSLVVVTALPSIHAALGGGDGTLQWIVNAYNLTFAAGIVTGAALGERYGRRRVFLTGLAVFTLASAACAVAPTLGLLVAFRAVQGLGGAILAPVGLTLVTAAFPAGKRGAAVGLWGGISGLGVAAGPLVGGAVTQGLDWHWIFWVNVPFGVLAFVGCALVLADSPARSGGSRQPLDLAGMALAGLTLAALVDGLAEAPTRGWTDGRVLLMLAAAVVLLVAFVVREARAAAPMIPLSLFRSPVFSAASAANLLGLGATFAAAYITSQFFQVGLRYTPLGTGLRFLPWTATPLLIAPLAGLLFDRLGARRVAAPGLFLQAAGFIWIVALAGAHASWGAYVAPFILAGVGISMALPSLPAAALSAAPPASLGAAAGVANTAQRVGSVVGIAVVTAVFDANGSLASAHATTSGYRPALLAAALLSALGAAAALAAGNKPRPFTP